ncbi:SSI family serine proteinase inhibitor [Streptomyces sp. NPDC059875]|uniref:SSI family serine proteinase inhibitor n=1 Tax=unclassified Streptomyces TaxID=2593676 RepID=UPI003659B220
MLRHLVLATLATTAAGAVGLGPVPPLPLLSSPAAPSSPGALTVTISKSGHPNADGTYRLDCGGKPGGNHPAAHRACARLATLAKEGQDPFKPVPKDAFCTQVYGGAVLARVTGEWRGDTVDARFSRANGCEIDRWENLEPVLPRVRG